jgi:NADP-dependent aldehyde dehydrogenase
MTQLNGTSIIGYERGAAGGAALQGVNPATGERLAPVFHGATLAEVDAAARLAEEAFREYSQLPGRARGAFLRRVADRVEALGLPLIERVTAETALPAARVQGELGRACAGLRMFAGVAEEGSWVDARIDHAEPERQPAPKPDLRSWLRPLGPVAVFGASNFPLAYSVAGGDTASALAAGCPVVVVAHYAHPGTAEMVGQAVSKAARECAMPEGVFSLLFGADNEVGQALVKHPLITAVGFTGSRRGGLALMKLAQNRSVPIPFYGEMSAVNPVFVLPGALRERGAEIAAGLAASVTLGVGQFCTNPGLAILPESAETDEFAATLQEKLAAVAPATMLTQGISAAYAEGLAGRQRADGVETLLPPRVGAPAQVAPALMRTNAPEFAANPALADEVFGPATLIVTHENRVEVLQLARNLEGQLTATIHGTDEDLREWAELLRILETRAGRLVYNGFPTGVEVCHAMVHGGPFPATSDGRTTAVGPRAIRRWARLVCYQGFPAEALPEELRDDNPLNIWRVVDGVTTT